MPTNRPEGVQPGLWSRPIPTRGILDWADRHKIGLVLAAGVALRVLQYLANRQYWMDEMSLVANLRDLTPRQFFGPLNNQQLAAPGFLIVGWASGWLFGVNPYAMRLVPLLGGIAGLFLFLAVARRCLAPRAVLPALVMFAVSDDLVYFATEVKQYSTDVASALACLLVGLTVGSRAVTWRSSALLAAWGASIVWFSHPSIFVLAAVGVVGMARSIGARDVRGGILWMLAGAAWVASFAAVHAVAMRQLDRSGQMWVFWNFAFPPVPRSAWDASWVFRRLAYYFVNPLNFDAPFGARLSMLPAVGLAILGFVRLWKADRLRFGLLTLPVAFTLLASCGRLYPFHGRLVLFLAPIPLLAIAAGLDRVREVYGRGWLHAALVAMVLVVPSLTAAIHLVEGQDREGNPYGDRRPIRLKPDRFPF